MTDEELKIKWADTYRWFQQLVDRGFRWRHYKGGRYSLVSIGLRKSDLEPHIIYISFDTCTCFCRPLCEWEEEVYDEEGNVVKRFTPEQT